jgi:EAL domain-containing protein (putative c-di-GMP-specific phosphodiesterase class I)
LPHRQPDAFLRELDAELSGWGEPVARMRQALERDELVLYCQPIAALTGAVRFPMAEALVRLREEEASLLPPGEFLPVFEHFRMMPLLDRWVLRSAVRHLAQGSRIPRLSINVSGQTVEDAAFPGAVAGALMASGVSGASLLFEIDESSLLAHADAAARFGSAVKAIGCGLTIDSFGRRAVSFAPLKALGVDFVKVDGVIVRRLLGSEHAEKKLRAVLRVGEAIGFSVIAEMVEEQDILTRLKALGVGYAQGFGIYQPHPLAGFAADRGESAR